MTGGADRIDLEGVPDVLAKIVHQRQRRYAAPPEPAAALAERDEPLTTADNRFLAALSGAGAGTGTEGGVDTSGGRGGARLRPSGTEGAEPREETSSSPTPGGAESGGAGSGGAESGGARSGGSATGVAAGGSRARIIAEVKMGSPRIGSLAGRVDPEAQAALYAGNGAAALSVVVEPDFFGGSYDLLQRCRRASGLPAIAKDFVVDGQQLEAAAGAGADAVLLIAALYSAGDLRRWARRARALGLAPLVETHDAADLAKLDGAPWELVGVNNRDLRTFEVDLEHSVRRLPELPAGALKVAESGIGSGADVARLAAAGFDAFLVGESLLLADDPAARLRELVAMREGTGG